MTIAVIVPTYNEADNVPRLVPELLKLGPNLHVVIVDDNSPDGTGRLADELASAYPHVHVIHRPGKLGLGTAYKAGFAKSLALGAERILTMDADFSHDPRYIPGLLAAAESCDVVIGSRYVDGGGTVNCKLSRRLLSRGANLVARTLLGLGAHDCTAGFRCYQRQALESLDLDSIVSDGYSFLVEMLYLCQERGYVVTEVPILFYDRYYGVSKVSKDEIFKAMATVLRLSFRRFNGARAVIGNQ